MQAAILAGGIGTRLKPLTEQVPKVMVPVNDKPFLMYLIELLKSYEINDIVLCVGYLGEQVKDFFGDGDSLGVRIRYSEEKGKLLGTGGALKQAQVLLDDQFLVINGDTYLPIDYREVERVFFRCGKKALMVVYDNQEDTGVKNNIELDYDLRVIRYNKDTCSPNLQYVDAGVLALKKEALDYLEEGCSISLEKGLYPILIKQGQLAAYISKQRFYDMGTLKQKRIFKEFLKKGA